MITNATRDIMPYQQNGRSRYIATGLFSESE